MLYIYYLKSPNTSEVDTVIIPAHIDEVDTMIIPTLQVK